MTRPRATRSPLLALPAVLLAAGLALAGCGSSTAEDTTVTPAGATPSGQAASTPDQTAPTSDPTTAPAGAMPSQAPASAVPAVSAKLGVKPSVAKGSGTASSSLLVHDVATGSGATAVDGDSLTVQYVGTFFTTGKQFDASWDRGMPFTFTLGAGAVIAGWDQGLVGMKAGGRRELVIPAALAYGPNDYNGIPGGSTLVFAIDLVSVASG